MFELNSLPIPGGVVVAGIAWAAIAGFGLGPVVAERTIENTSWPVMCESALLAEIAEEAPRETARPDISCRSVLGVFGAELRGFCAEGGDQLFDLLTIDPLASQKAALRQREAARLDRIAALAPSRCSCAASVVASDRVTWGLYAGSARLAGGPKNLNADLIEALHAPACAQLGERNAR